MFDVSKCPANVTSPCYICGILSDQEWAPKVNSGPSSSNQPYYPILLQLRPAKGAVLEKDGSTYVCPFCYALLTAQWNIYEMQQSVPPSQRQYTIHYFICAVCGVQTYRKRVMALPFEQFPFLWIQRHSGSVTLNNKLAVVCLDCLETLWAQSVEYDKMGLPIHKRQFNWMARPPPPEDSVESTVARLPSGETQLPRCSLMRPAIISPQIIENTKLSASESRRDARTRENLESKAKGNRVWSRAPRHSHISTTGADIGDFRGQHFLGHQTNLTFCAPHVSKTAGKSRIDNNRCTVGVSRVAGKRKTVQTFSTPHPTLNLVRCECEMTSLSHGSCNPVRPSRLSVESSLTAKSPMDIFLHKITEESLRVSCVNARKIHIETQRSTAYNATSSEVLTEKPVPDMNRYIPNKSNCQDFTESSQILASATEHELLQSPSHKRNFEEIDTRHPKKKLTWYLEKLYSGNDKGSQELPGSSNAGVCSRPEVHFEINAFFNGYENVGLQADRATFRPSVIKWAPKRRRKEDTVVEEVRFGMQ